MGNNAIRTSKYSLITFLPLNLFAQFQKAANVYFLLITYLQTIKMISISGGKPAMIVPLVLVIFVSMVKDAYEDYKRAKNDNIENTSKAYILDPVSATFTQSTWKNVKVGNILQLKTDDPIPCDMLILHTSDAKGICYVETKNLDGETNLKIKTANKEL